jgi:hypothetical protein
MALVFTSAWRQQKARNEREARNLIDQFGGGTLPILNERIESEKTSKRDRDHWKRVLAHVRSMVR